MAEGSGDRLLTVARSYDRDTTKGGHADVIPIAKELIPYLKAALATSPSDLLFPAEDGSMMADNVQLQRVLRRALHRAGIVAFYVHKCRRKGCGHSERAADSELRRCPKCRMKLWPAGQVRPIRFHHLRHYADLRVMPTRGSTRAACRGAAGAEMFRDAA